ncbi:MAG TPA: glycoside hydrolase family 38 C-terminal domain-containing protein, partial [Acidimicrobiales bacterium]|nr:glycoside hydrolase family 38 C-terminal domain-containing protein [Acidimicrobiales bacterium]
MSRRVSIVPHTHWDREWYAPFQAFRLRLVDLLDEFLPLVERDLSYARFLLDGQMAVVDDYLEVRPEAEPLLRRLAASGRLSMGPWYILMDEFLVSGETMIRDLQMGLERAAAFGGGMQVGYLPDMFGHVAQMPQLLKLAGIEHAVVWRGVPSDVDRSAFWWEAPDGSTVRAEYLMTGYGNGAAIPDDAKALVRRIAAHEEELSSFLLDGLLFMNGTDHEVPQPWLGRVVDEVNEIQDDYVLEVTSLPEYLASAPTTGLPRWQGELRSGARANLLMGVASNRVDVKQAAARTERALERSAEPLCALFMAPEAYPTALLGVAWKEVVRNAAHDSICACSVDEVVDAVLHRFAAARQIADGLTVRALKALGSSVATEGTYIVNGSARARGGLIEVVLPGEGPVEGAQVLTERPAVLSDLTLTGAELGAVLGQIRSQQLDDTTYVNAVSIDDSDDGIDLTLHADSRLRENLMVEEVKRDLFARVGERPDVQVRIRIQQPPSVRILTRVEPVPGYGWAPFTAEAPRCAPVVVTNDAAGVTVANGLLTLVVDTATGLYAIDGHGGLGRLVDDGDHGDTYNYSPPATDTVVDTPDAVTVEALEDGPMRARIAIRAIYTWPEKVAGRTDASRHGERTVHVETTLEVQAGEPFVRVHTRFDNPSRDHRLRAWFPLPTPATTSQAECAFAVVERGLEAEGGPTERGLPTFPSRRFVRAGGLTVAHEGLLEYELVEDGTALALTLLRATGMLSRVEMSYR